MAAKRAANDMEIAHDLFVLYFLSHYNFLIIYLVFMLASLSHVFALVLFNLFSEFLILFFPSPVTSQSSMLLGTN